MTNYLLVVLLMLATATASAIAGSVAGIHQGRVQVANECRLANAFAVNRTGFRCHRIGPAKPVEQRTPKQQQPENDQASTRVASHEL